MPKLSKDALDERRSHILRAAEVCFARDGFHRATIADVCKQAGVSTGAVYVYFPNKEAIVSAMLQEAQAKRRAQLEAAESGSDPAQVEQVLLEWARAIFTNEGQHASKIDVNLWAEAAGNPRVAKIAAAALAEATRTVREVVAARQPADGPLGELDPEAVASVLVAVFLGLEVQTAVGVSLGAAEVLRVLATLFSPLPAESRASRGARPSALPTESRSSRGARPSARAPRKKRAS